MKKLKLVHLYPEEMNIYGDNGNRLVLEKRLSWRRIPYELVRVGVGDKLPEDADIILGGGGQDSGQQIVEADLASKAPQLKGMAERGVVMLMICGMYQLFGRVFITKEGKSIDGIGVLPLYTQAGEKRLIGNIIVESPWGELVGYENHSGRTFLDEGCAPLAKVVHGAGNNGQDRGEGARYKNVFGSYMHGPLLSKNPDFADVLIGLAEPGVVLKGIDDSLAIQARNIAKTRPR